MSHLRWKYKTRRVWVSPCRGVLHTPHIYPVRGKRKTFDDQMCKMIFGPKGRLWGVCNTPLLGKMNTCRVWMSPCRGVLYTPHRYPVRGKRKAFYDQMCKMIFGPKGRLWGVCNTLLLGKMNTRRVWVSPCRGVLHTPYRYPIRGKRKAFDDQMCKMIFGPKGRLWGVCNTPLLGKMKTQHVLVLLLSRKYKTRRV